MSASHRLSRSNDLLPGRSLLAAATLPGQRCSSAFAYLTSAVAAPLTASPVHVNEASPLLPTVSGPVRAERFTTLYGVLTSVVPCTL